MPKHRRGWKGSLRPNRLLIVICALVLVAAISIFYLKDTNSNANGNSGQEYTDVAVDGPNQIKNGIHVRTGLIDAPGLQETVSNCTSCHSAKLVMQNRMSAERWHATIRWMQETQNLWPLGENEDIIVNYLVTNYPPMEKGRRAALADVEWYALKD